MDDESARVWGSGRARSLCKHVNPFSESREEKVDILRDTRRQYGKCCAAELSPCIRLAIPVLCRDKHKRGGRFSRGGFWWRANEAGGSVSREDERTRAEDAGTGGEHDNLLGLFLHQCPPGMANTSSSIIFDDIFTINAIDKEGKKFDRGPSVRL